jgi:hypothetical protein
VEMPNKKSPAAVEETLKGPGNGGIFLPHRFFLSSYSNFCYNGHVLLLAKNILLHFQSIILLMITVRLRSLKEEGLRCRSRKALLLLSRPWLVLEMVRFSTSSSCLEPIDKLMLNWLCSSAV